MTDILAVLRRGLAGSHEIERELGRGGMARVFLARELKHDRLVAPLVGLIAGVCSGTLAVSGPVLGAYLLALDVSATTFAFTVSLMFVSMSLLRLGGLILAGELAPWLALGLGLLPPAIVGQRVGFWLQGRVSRQIFQRVALALMFLFTAFAHFNWMRADLVRMVPGFVPNPEFWVTFTGIAEIAGALGLVIPRFAPLAAAGLTLLLFAVFPANVHAALSGLTLDGKPATPLALRTVEQIIFLAAVVVAGFGRKLFPSLRSPANLRHSH